MNRPQIIALALLVAAFVSCGGGNAPRNRTLSEHAAGLNTGSRPPRELITSVSPSLKDVFVQGDEVTIAYRKSVDSLSLDSVLLYIDGVRVGRISERWSYPTDATHPVGRILYRVVAYKDRDSTVRVGEFLLRPKHSPVSYGYRVVNTYPHDRQAYTQGLYWHNGYLYEGTGQEGLSSLRRVELTTGKVLQQHDLDRQYFGEGIALLNGKIYQLTWKNNRGFIYDANTFQPLDEFGYSGEGWGLTTDGTYLYLSNGTEKIFVIDPSDFKRLRTIEVYTPEGKVDLLNELEWIDGEIWANVYTSDAIVRIDPATGVVQGIVDMRGLLQAADKDIHTDVFNGIAYDPASRRIFVTGKNWSKLFQVEIVRK